MSWDPDELRNKLGQWTAGSSAPSTDDHVTDKYLSSLPAELRTENSARNSFRQKLFGLARESGGVPLFHEGPGDLADKIRRAGFVGDAHEGVFATIGQPSNYVTSSHKTVVEFKVPGHSIGSIIPDMKYHGLEKLGPHQLLMIEHPNLRGAYVHFADKVPQSWIRNVTVK